MSGGEGKVQCYKEQYHIKTWNDRSMNQSKLDVIKQETARKNINILKSNELNRTGMGEVNLDDNYIYDCGQNSLEEIVNKKVQNSLLRYNLKNDSMISVNLQDNQNNRKVWSWGTN